MTYEYFYSQVAGYDIEVVEMLEESCPSMDYVH